MTAFTRWLVARLAKAVLVVFGAVTAAFFALRLTPGDPARAVLGGIVPTPELLARVRHDLGFDQPLPVQFGHYLGQLLRGDLGQSYQLQQPVAAVIGEQLPATVELAVSSLVLALVVALGLAVATAGRRRGWRRLSTGVELVVSSSPAFWIGILLLTVFSFRLNLLPAAGSNGLASLVLPAVTLALSMVGVFAQVLRESMERALAEGFVLSSRARGTGETAVRVRHALRHALIPLTTLSGWTVGSLLGGTVVVETVFSRQGLGRVIVGAITGRDFPVVTGIVLLSAIVFTVVNLAVDALYRLLDPRLRELAL